MSPLLFNIVLDELVGKLSNISEGCSMGDGVNCSVMAFADDLVLLAETERSLQRSINISTEFFTHRGMAVNPSKCYALIKHNINGAVVPLTNSSITIQGRQVTHVSDVNPIRYLGHQFGSQGQMKPCLSNYPVWLQRLVALPLKPDQKFSLLKTYLLPRIMHSLMGTKVTKEVLGTLDKMNRHYTKKILHLHLHTSKELIHAPIREGGLAVCQLTVSVPQILLSRLSRLQSREAVDPVVAAMLTSRRVFDFRVRLQKMVSQFPAGGHRELMEKGVFSKGLTCANQDSASRYWIGTRPAKWSAGDWVRAVHLRTTNLPTVGIPSNPVELRGCRGGCGAMETVCHILQKCPVAHDERIQRHDAVVKKIAAHCVREGWRVDEEPRVRHDDGTLYKPDLVIFKTEARAVVADAQVSWETGSSMQEVWNKKKAVYGNAKFLGAARKKWPNTHFTFLPVILGARGIWPSCNSPTETELNIKPPLKRSCVASTLKWGCSAHKTFMRRIWKLPASQRFRQGSDWGVPANP
ncbi:hypothetical protein Zmor_014573 [Zophobas morio]|uniref:Reverse transcriptase domain-containing protein n=1 Tax=Zophobas morio TaxID=2755281 RepID=A0AA38IHL9_9CUCU|nr:hypothetical protein Zmor_014573 [Zophobas morio]